MASLTVTSSKEIRCPIDVVRAQFTDLKHHITNNVHRNLEFTLHSSDERRCDFTQGYRVLGFMRRDEIRLEREADGSLHGKFVEGASQGTETFVTFESLHSGSTRVQFKAVVPLRGLMALAKPLVKRQLERDIAKGLEEDRIDLEERGYPRA
jgi:hypothetical protein